MPRHFVGLHAARVSRGGHRGCGPRTSAADTHARPADKRLPSAVGLRRSTSDRAADIAKRPLAMCRILQVREDNAHHPHTQQRPTWGRHRSAGSRGMARIVAARVRADMAGLIAVAALASFSSAGGEKRACV